MTETRQKGRKITATKITATKTHLVLDGGLLVLVEVDLDQTGSVLLDAGALANDLSRIDQVVQGGLVDRGQSAAAKSNERRERERRDMSESGIERRRRCRARRRRRTRTTLTFSVSFAWTWIGSCGLASAGFVSEIDELRVRDGSSS